MTAISTQITKGIPQNNWDKIADHPLQSWAWGEFRKAMGIDLVRFGIESYGQLTQTCQLTFHKIPHTPWTVGYFPKGPQPNKHMIDELKNICKEKSAVYMQLEPNVILTHDSLLLTHDALIFSHHPLFTKYTFVLDLTKPEDELLSLMHSKTRYNIKVARKNGVTVQEDNSSRAFEAYLKLTSATTLRQEFYAHSQDYHRIMWKILYPAGIAKLFTASYRDNILAAWILFVWKNTLYYPYGASSRLHREVMAPTLMLWETALWGKRRGLKQYDLWGALGPNPDPKDPWYGFHRFKEGFRPQLVESIGSYDLVVQPLLYTLYKGADSLRWLFLRTKSKLK